MADAKQSVQRKVKKKIIVGGVLFERGEAASDFFFQKKKMRRVNENYPFMVFRPSSGRIRTEIISNKILAEMFGLYMRMLTAVCQIFIYLFCDKN